MNPSLCKMNLLFCLKGKQTEEDVHPLIHSPRASNSQGDLPQTEVGGFELSLSGWQGSRDLSHQVMPFRMCRIRKLYQNQRWKSNAGNSMWHVGVAGSSLH